LFATILPILIIVRSMLTSSKCFSSNRDLFEENLAKKIET